MSLLSCSGVHLKEGDVPRGCPEHLAPVENSHPAGRGFPAPPSGWGRGSGSPAWHSLLCLRAPHLLRPVLRQAGRQ